MLGKIARLLRPGAPVAQRLHPGLEQIASIVGNGIQDNEDFVEKAQPAVESALIYFDRQIDQIPGPLDVSCDLLARGAPCSALFPHANDLVHGLGRSLAVKDMLPELLLPGDEHFYAVLGMRRRPGPDGITAYTDHTLRSLGTSLDGVRENLRQAAFERLLKQFAEHVDKLRRRERLLTIEWEWSQRHDDAPPPEAGDHPEFVYAARELTPPRLLQGLLGWLNAPGAYLRVERDGTTVAGGNTEDLPVLHSNDRRQWLVTLVRIPIQEAIDAQMQETHMHRYLFI